MCPVALEYPEPEDDDPRSEATDSLEELEREMEKEDRDEEADE
jgi:hypothetical protein